MKYYLRTVLFTRIVILHLVSIKIVSLKWTWPLLTLNLLKLISFSYSSHSHYRPIIFTYSTAWVSSTIPFEKRFNRYLEYNFVESQIHWFSIFNSFMIVVFLAGLVTLIMMRTLKLDYIRYSQNIAEIGTSQSDDSGWKRVHGDVFRPCEHLRLYCLLMVFSYF